MTAKLSMLQGVNTIGGTARVLDRALDLDAQLMLRVRDGDEQSFAVLLEKHRNPVIHFVFRMVQDRAIAEELSQEVFLRVYRSRGTYEPTAKFTTWLFRIATHLALNWLRDGRNERAHQRLDAPRDSQKDGELPVREVSDRTPSVEQHMVYQTRLQEIRDAIGSLPEKQRAAVLMHKYEEMEYSQIAHVLECSESAVKSLLFRAYESLRASLAYMVTGATK
ncbi:MAG TPA: RNA polymerase sigma factor [Bryobacteraceae bacterium]|jgi:RNA polymerase sigma-70 factor (ECF subfamily)|nr:RNA polymerase sigma factor [Bryobacteraceae bacterium]